MAIFRRKLYVIFPVLLFMLLVGCDPTIEPIKDRGKEYSIYGPLDLESTPNYIRVHDTRALLNQDATKDLDVEMVFTNLSTGESSLLEENVVLFDGIYTHNYRVEMPIEYDTRYKIKIEDEEGFRDSLISVTSKKTELTVLQDTVECEERFRFEMSNIDLESGEQLDAEVGIRIGNTWIWTSRRQGQTYYSSQRKLILSWSPNGISRLIFGSFDWYPCEEFTSDKIRFRFTHIGYVEGAKNPNIEDEDTISVQRNRKIVLSKYSGQAEFKIADEVFLD